MSSAPAVESKLPFDYLGLASNGTLASTLSAYRKGAAGKQEACLGVDPSRVQEDVVFSSTLTKVNRWGSKQRRDIVVTTLAVYNFKPGSYGSWQRRIPLHCVGRVVQETGGTGRLLLHMWNYATEYDYELVLPVKEARDAFILALQRAHRALVGSDELAVVEDSAATLDGTKVDKADMPRRVQEIKGDELAQRAIEQRAARVKASILWPEGLPIPPELEGKLAAAEERAVSAGKRPTRGVAVRASRTSSGAAGGGAGGGSNGSGAARQSILQGIGGAASLLSEADAAAALADVREEDDEEDEGEDGDGGAGSRNGEGLQNGGGGGGDSTKKKRAGGSSSSSAGPKDPLKVARTDPSTPPGLLQQVLAVVESKIKSTATAGGPGAADAQKLVEGPLTKWPRGTELDRARVVGQCMVSPQGAKILGEDPAALQLVLYGAAALCGFDELDETMTLEEGSGLLPDGARGPSKWKSESKEGEGGGGGGDDPSLKRRIRLDVAKASGAVRAWMLRCAWQAVSTATARERQDSEAGKLAAAIRDAGGFSFLALRALALHFPVPAAPRWAQDAQGAAAQRILPPAVMADGSEPAEVARMVPVPVTPAMYRALLEALLGRLHAPEEGLEGGETFGQPIQAAAMLPLMVRCVRLASCWSLRKDILKDINVLLIRREDNFPRVLTSPDWQSWLAPLLALVPKRAGARSEECVEYTKYVLNLYAMVLHHVFGRGPEIETCMRRFFRLLRLQCGGWTNEVIGVARSLLGNLLVKVASGSNRWAKAYDKPQWQAMFALLKVTYDFVFYMPAEEEDASAAAAGGEDDDDPGADGDDGEDGESKQDESGGGGKAKKKKKKDKKAEAERLMKEPGTWHGLDEPGAQEDPPGGADKDNRHKKAIEAWKKAQDDRHAGMPVGQVLEGRERWLGSLDRGAPALSKRSRVVRGVLSVLPDFASPFAPPPGTSAGRPGPVDRSKVGLHPADSGDGGGDGDACPDLKLARRVSSLLAKLGVTDSKAPTGLAAAARSSANAKELLTAGLREKKRWRGVEGVLQDADPEAVANFLADEQREASRGFFSSGGANKQQLAAAIRQQQSRAQTARAARAVVRAKRQKATEAKKTLQITAEMEAEGEAEEEEEARAAEEARARATEGKGGDTGKGGAAAAGAGAAASRGTGRKAKRLRGAGRAKSDRSIGGSKPAPAPAPASAAAASAAPAGSSGPPPPPPSRPSGTASAPEPESYGEHAVEKALAALEAADQGGAPAAAPLDPVAGGAPPPPSSGAGADAVAPAEEAAAASAEQAAEEEEEEEAAIADIECGACGNPMGDAPCLEALGKYWHESCFVCCDCGDELADRRFFSRKGAIYCRRDYLERFGKSVCAGCMRSFKKNEQAIEAAGRVWHPDHFACAECERSFGDDEPFFVKDKMAYCGDCNDRLFLACPQCNQPVLDDQEGLSALGHNWHIACFRCEAGGCSLAEQKFFPRDGKPYCEDHFSQLFAPKCARCSMPIREDGVYACGSPWHYSCFGCTECGVLFDGGKYFEVEGRPYCTDHYWSNFGKRCSACEEPIRDKVFNALDRDWHFDCFACAECKAPFPDMRFFSKNGKPYCRADFGKLFCEKCPKCAEPVIEGALKALGKLWHPECLTCTYDGCTKQLKTGIFKGEDGMPYCEEHFNYLFAAVCKRCNKPVSSGRVISALDAKWHEACFSCPGHEGSGCSEDLTVPGASIFNHDGYPFCQTHFLLVSGKPCHKCGKTIYRGKQLTVFDLHFHPECFSCSACDSALKPTDKIAKNPCSGGPMCFDCLVLYFDLCPTCDSAVQGAHVKVMGRKYHPDCLACVVCETKFQSAADGSVEGLYQYGDWPVCETHAVEDFGADTLYKIAAFDQRCAERSSNWSSIMQTGVWGSAASGKTDSEVWDAEKTADGKWYFALNGESVWSLDAGSTIRMPNAAVCVLATDADSGAWQELRDDDGDSYFVKDGESKWDLAEGDAVVLMLD